MAYKSFDQSSLSLSMFNLVGMLIGMLIALTLFI